MKELPETITTSNLAKLLGISVPALRRHVNEGNIPQVSRGTFDLIEAVNAYTAHLRATASGRGGEEGVRTLEQERARLAAAQAEGAELKNSMARGEVVAAADVELRWSSILADVQKMVLAFPSRVGQAMPHLSRDDVAIIDEEIRAMLTELSETAGEA